MRFIDMFCGIGGFRYGLEQASKQFKCVWSNDNDKYACQIYRKHFGEVCEGDIRAVDASAIPEHDLLCAGFPCQSFSLAGKRRGFEDTRGTLFFEICRVIRAKRPGYLLLENVKGLLSHDDGATFQTIIRTLDELGYDCQWQVLNCNRWLPQSRERTFIICNLRAKPRPQIFPIMEENENHHAVDEKIPAISTLTAAYTRTGYGSGRPFVIHGTFVEGVDGQIGTDVKDKGQELKNGGVLQEMALGSRDEGIQKTLGTIQNRCGLPKEKGGDISGQLLLAQMPIPLQESEEQCGVLGCQNQEEQGKRSGSDKETEGTGLDCGKGMGTQAENGLSPLRSLTLEECEQLQGFPIGWTDCVSENQRYKCLGNAVMPIVAETTGRLLILYK